MKKYVKVEDILDLLVRLAREHFSVMDPGYRDYLNALDDVRTELLKEEEKHDGV